MVSGVGEERAQHLAPFCRFTSSATWPPFGVYLAALLSRFT